jgi:hypothetical protein
MDKFSVDAALRRANLQLKVTPVAIMLLFMVAPFVVSEVVDVPIGWLFATGFIGGFVVGWMWWSIAVTRWRIWALQHVRNIHELMEVAVAEKFIWPKGHFFERTEIRTAGQRAMLEALGVRLRKPDVWKDDPQVPEFTEIRWSRKARVVPSVMLLCVAGLGGYMFLQNIGDIWGWGLLITVSVFSILDIRKLGDSRVQVQLDRRGVTWQGRHFFPWPSIKRDRVVLKVSGRSAITVLEFEHQGVRIEIPINQLDLPKEELRHRMRVYRFRSGHFPTIAS